MRFSESELLIDQRLSHLAENLRHKDPQSSEESELSPRLPTLPFAAASISAPCDNCDQLRVLLHQSWDNKHEKDMEIAYG